MADEKPRLKYHCVEVVAGNGACEAARLLTNLRLLSTEAPRLPLEACADPASCKCVYRHFADRRQGPRRQNEHARVVLGHDGMERRSQRGRREVDYD